MAVVISGRVLDNRDTVVSIHTGRRLRAVMTAFATAMLCVKCGSAPTVPCTDQYGRGDTNLNEIKVSCATIGAQLQCRALADIGGLYVYCPRQQDVTEAATWFGSDASIVRVLTPGVFTAVGVGHTAVHAVWSGLDSDDFARTPVAVFPGTAPLPTYEIWGDVWLAGQTWATSAIDGAVIEVLDGLVVGQTSTSGQPPPLLPGYLGPRGGRGSYSLLGVPPGTYRLRISKNGYVSQEQTVSVTTGDPEANFQLVPL
jgi:hypothetical protein